MKIQMIMFDKYNFALVASKTGHLCLKEESMYNIWDLELCITYGYNYLSY